MEEQKRKRGPEPKPPEEIRSNRISLRLTDDELSSIKERAGTDSPKQVADYIRASALGKRMPSRIPEINREAWASLSRSSSNLNQIARALNSDQAVDADTIRRQLEDFRLALIGARRDGDES